MEIKSYYGPEGFSIGVKDIKNEVERHLQAFAFSYGQSQNPFPVEVFPGPIQQIISATNENLNFPIDFIGASLLFGASLAIGNTLNLEVMKGWRETATLYVPLVGKPGTNKSHPLTFALKPLEEKDKKTHRDYESKMLEYRKAMSRLKGEKDKKSFDEPVKLVWQKFIVSDFTPEALAEVHKFNKRGIGVYSDELAGWFKNFNRYHKGAEQEFWLSAWSSKSINIDRKTGEPVFIPMPFIPVIGTIQNGVLTEMGKDSRSQNGFFDRILFVIPDDLQKPYWSDKEMAPSIIDNWASIIQKIVDLPLPLDETLNPVPRTLQFSSEAKASIKQWQRTNADLCNNSDGEALAGIYSKLETYAVRLALILEVMLWACNEGDLRSVGTRAVAGSLKLIEYFRKTAVKVQGIISNNSSPLDKLSGDKRALYEALPDTFSTSQGTAIAESLGIPKDTFNKFLRRHKSGLFGQLEVGEWAKLF